MIDKKMTLYELDEYDIKTIVLSAKLLSGRKKEAKDIRDFKTIGDHTFIDVENLISFIDNLNYELKRTQDKLIEMTNDLDNGSYDICDDPYEYNGVSKSDFI